MDERVNNEMKMVLVWGWEGLFLSCRYGTEIRQRCCNVEGRMGKPAGDVILGMNRGDVEGVQTAARYEMKDNENGTVQENSTFQLCDSILRETNPATLFKPAELGLV